MKKCPSVRRPRRPCSRPFAGRRVSDGVLLPPRRQVQRDFFSLFLRFVFFIHATLFRWPVIYVDILRVYVNTHTYTRRARTMRNRFIHATDGRVIKRGDWRKKMYLLVLFNTKIEPYRSLYDRFRSLCSVSNRHIIFAARISLFLYSKETDTTRSYYVFLVSASTEYIF